MYFRAIRLIVRPAAGHKYKELWWSKIVSGGHFDHCRPVWEEPWGSYAPINVMPNYHTYGLRVGDGWGIDC